MTKDQLRMIATECHGVSHEWDALPQWMLSADKHGLDRELVYQSLCHVGTFESGSFKYDPNNRILRRQAQPAK